MFGFPIDLPSLGPAARAVPALTALAALGLTACAGPGAATRYADTPVLVVGEDEDETTVKRSSDVFKRVLAELTQGMKRTGFRMVDEESVAVDLGWKVKDRRPKRELIEVAKLMTRSGKASHRVRAMVLFRIHATAESVGGATKVQTRIDGEIYDVVSNEFIGTFEMPRREYPAPAQCLDSEVCIAETVGDRAREIAGSLGVVLARKLARYRDVSAGGTGGHRAGGGPVAGDEGRTGGGQGAAAGGSGHGMRTPYTVTLRYFDRREALAIMGVMADEFPGYRSHALIGQASAVRRYEYVTSAKPHEMEGWIATLLGDMNFDPGREAAILLRGSEITVEKIVPPPGRPKSRDERARFR